MLFKHIPNQMDINLCCNNCCTVLSCGCFIIIIIIRDVITNGYSKLIILITVLAIASISF